MENWHQKREIPFEKVEINTKIRKINTEKREFPLENGKLTPKKEIPFEKVEINTKITKINTEKREFPLENGKLTPKKGNSLRKSGN